VFLDLDLSILSVDAQEYLVYREAIKREYSHVKDFEKKRLEFLQTF